MRTNLLKAYGVMIVGCGHIGEEHAADIYFRDGVRLVAVVDAEIEKANLFRRKYEAEVSASDYRPLLARSDIDIVIIATYVDSHLSILRDCIAAGKHVLCEKPVAGNEAAGKEFFRLAMEAKTAVAVAHVLRFNKTFRTIKQLIDDGCIGTLKVARMVQNHHCINWDRYRRLLADCSPIVDCGIHYFDLLQWYAESPIVQVNGIGTTVDTDLAESNYNYGMANIRLKNGVVGYYEAGWGKTFSSSNVKEFIGTEGRITLTMNQFRSTHTEEGDLIEVYSNDQNLYQTINVDSHYKPMWDQLQGLICKIEGKPTNTPTLKESYSAFEASMAADKAIREGKLVFCE